MKRMRLVARTRQAIIAALLGMLTLAALAAPALARPADPAIVGYPNSIASTGDSITRAFNTGPVPFTDAPQNSWSTGTAAAVASHYSRILAAHRAIAGHVWNDAATGSQMVALNAQVAQPVAQHAAYITILLGANDACTATEAQMTAVDTYRAQFLTALQTLSAGLPNARIFVAGVPNIYQLWQIEHGNPLADTVWTVGHICQSMLANPWSLLPPDVARRQRVLQRVEDYNSQLAAVCAQFIHCRFDHGAVFNTAFTAADISTRDYFHPTVTGQALLASATYGATFNFTDGLAPVSTVTTAPVFGGLQVTLAATDNVGVAGIEYKIGAGAYTRYTRPVFLAHAQTMLYRAVDVNGNVEASHRLSAP